jgi:hypothetical protein
MSDHLDGCALDFTEETTSDEEIRGLLAKRQLGIADAASALAFAGRDLGLASRLRAAELAVKEVAGWQSRGDPTFNGKGAVTHHTAGAATGLAPSLGICINGRAGLRGPLCNVYMDREGTVYVVASGKANHAGTGSWKGVTGNSQMWGLEIEHPGRTLLDAKRVKLAARVQAACIRGTASAAMVCQHSEWDAVANGGEGDKIDVATNFPTAAKRNAFRAMVAAELKALERVTSWEVTWTNPAGERVKTITKRPVLWTEIHTGAFQRAGVVFRPKRP